jgi:serine protease inhibitor
VPACLPGCPPALLICLPACLPICLPALQALKDMGVEEPFSDRAEFGKLSTTPLKIDDIYHSVSAHMHISPAAPCWQTAVVQLFCTQALPQQQTNDILGLI